jgi:hypothetical protein
MSKTKLTSIPIAWAMVLIPVYGQQSNPNPQQKPAVILENKEKPPKESDTRTISGLVKDERDNPIRGAIIQLKDMKTSQVIDFPTKDDGKFAFHDLRMDIDYELTAKHDGLTLMKKVSIYDTRKNVVLTFKLEPEDKDATAR